MGRDLQSRAELVMPQRAATSANDSDWLPTLVRHKAVQARVP